MKKFLSILAAVGLTSTAASAVVACGDKDKNIVPETGDLSKILTGSHKELVINITTELDENSPQSALDAFLNSSGNEVLRNEVQVKEGESNYVLPDINEKGAFINGKLVIQAIPTSDKYTGEATIIIKFQKVSLESIEDKITTEIQGSADITEENVLSYFLSTSNNEFLDYEVDVKEHSFKAPTAAENGSFVIVSEKGSPLLSGQLTITITKLSNN